MKRFILIAFLIFAFSFKGWAVDIEPARLELKVSPGEVFQGALEVVNDHNYPIDLFISGGEYSYVFLDWTIPPKDKDKQCLPSCASWIEFASTKVRLNTGEKAKIPYSISVPYDAQSEHLASILFDERRVGRDMEEREANAIKLTFRRREPVYLIVEGREHASAEIRHVKINKGKTPDSPEVIIEILNTGNIHLRPSGNIVVEYAEGGVIEETAQFKTLPLFPYYQGKVRVPLKELPLKTEYAITVNIDIGNGIPLQETVFFTLDEQGAILY